MKLADGNLFRVGARLTVTFALLIGLIVAGNGLLIWQFRLAQAQTERLTEVSQQLISVLRLQESLMRFHQRLGELADSRDAQLLASEAEPLRRALQAQTQRTRSVLAELPPEARVDPAFLPTLEAIEITMPSQIAAITALGASGDWEAVRMRVSNELKPLETQTSALVNSMDLEASEELARSVTHMQNVQRRMLLLVPLTALVTFFTAAFFAWVITRRLVELRAEARVNERTRIARELHDTLLQSFQGLLLRFQTVSELFATRPEEAKRTLDSAIEQAAQAVTEGRDAVQQLRSVNVSATLAESITALGEQLVADGECLGNAAEFRVGVEGNPRALQPILQDEVYRIAGEALRNAFRHAQARRIELEIHYDDRQLRLWVRDDGKGIAPEVLRENGRAGHFGLRGMRERAKLLGGKLTLWSDAQEGTEVELRIPGSTAYAEPSTGEGQTGER